MIEPLLPHLAAGAFLPDHPNARHVIKSFGAEAAPGAVGTSIFLAVQVTSITNVVKIMLDLGHPLAMIEEIVNGMKFAAAGANAGHFQYGPYVPVILAYLQQLADQHDGPILLVTINGTGVADPFDNGPTSFPGWVGWAVADPMVAALAQCFGPQWQQKFIWLPVGYPAAVSNMWSSVKKGAAAHLQTMQSGGGIHAGPWPVGTPVVIFGYSQGAMVANYCGVNYYLSAAGPLHDRYVNGDLKAIWNVGDPNRQPGRADGNLAAGIPLPANVDGQVTGGISGGGVPSQGILGDLTDAQTTALNVKSIALANDLYAVCPTGPSPWS